MQQGFAAGHDDYSHDFSLGELLVRVAKSKSLVQIASAK